MKLNKIFITLFLVFGCFNLFGIRITNKTGKVIGVAIKDSSEEIVGLSTFKDSFFKYVQIENDHSVDIKKGKLHIWWGRYCLFIKDYNSQKTDYPKNTPLQTPIPNNLTIILKGNMFAIEEYQQNSDVEKKGQRKGHRRKVQDKFRNSIKPYFQIPEGYQNYDEVRETSCESYEDNITMEKNQQDSNIESIQPYFQIPEGNKNYDEIGVTFYESYESGVAIEKNQQDSSFFTWKAALFGVAAIGISYFIYKNISNKKENNKK